MSTALMEQHRAHIERRARLGMVPVSKLSREYLRSLPAPRPKYELPPLAQPLPKRDRLLTLPTKPVGPEGGEQWPAQPRPVFYDEAAPSPSRTWQDILREECIDHDVSMADVLGPRHFKGLVAVRDAAAFRMAVELGMSYAAIGRRLFRDHTTIVASLARYVRCRPEAAAALRAQRDKVRRQRQALKDEAARLYLHEGKTLKEIRELLPLSIDSIRNALKEWREWH